MFYQSDKRFFRFNLILGGRLNPYLLTRINTWPGPFLGFRDTWLLSTVGRQHNFDCVKYHPEDDTYSQTSGGFKWRTWGNRQSFSFLATLHGNRINCNPLPRRNPDMGGEVWANLDAPE